MMSDKYELEDAYLETLYDHDYFLAHGISKGSQILPQKIAQGFQKDEDKINAKRILFYFILFQFTLIRMREKDRSDRATHQQVLDQRTYLVLLKFFKGHLLGEVNGCISTGKEANVYHGATPDNEARAIKIYKTSILIFKYVSGEYRFKGGYNKQNPRQMVRVWAEKEFRNLMRLQTAGIRSPKPIAQRQHLLIMSFIGDQISGNSAPRLKDFVSQKNNTELTQSKLIDLYWEAVKIMHQMYHECHLVHADLSEYNILYYEGHLFVIDVSQSVEHDHPLSFDFLRQDAQHINLFFSNCGVNVLTTKELFEFIINTTPETKRRKNQKIDKNGNKLEKRRKQQGSDTKYLKPQFNIQDTRQNDPKQILHFIKDKKIQENQNSNDQLSQDENIAIIHNQEYIEIKNIQKDNLLNQELCIQQTNSNMDIVDAEINRLRKMTENRDYGEIEEDGAFIQTFIPRSTHQINNIFLSSEMNETQTVMIEHGSDIFKSHTNDLNEEEKEDEKEISINKDQNPNETEQRIQPPLPLKDQQQACNKLKDQVHHFNHSKYFKSIQQSRSNFHQQIPQSLNILSFQDQISQITIWETPLINTYASQLLLNQTPYINNTIRQLKKCTDNNRQLPIYESENEDQYEISNSDNDEISGIESSNQNDSLDEDEKMEQEELALLLLHKQIRTIEQSKIQENNFAEENLNEVAMITAAMSDAQQQEIEEKQREIRINLPKTYTIPESGSSVAVRRRGTKEEPELKKQRKQEVKRSKQEKRQIKIPKAMKHRAIAQSKKK